MVLSAKTFRTIPPEKLPSVLLFCSTEDLDAFLGGSLSQERKVFIAAELFLRYLFNPAKEIKVILDRVFTHRETDNFHSLFHDIFPVSGADQIPALLWKTDDPFSSACEIILRKQLADLFSEEKTCGFIPVYSPDGSGFLIPFHFIGRKNAATPRNLRSGWTDRRKLAGELPGGHAAGRRFGLRHPLQAGTSAFPAVRPQLHAAALPGG